MDADAKADSNQHANGQAYVHANIHADADWSRSQAPVGTRPTITPTPTPTPRPGTTPTNQTSDRPFSASVRYLSHSIDNGNRVQWGMFEHRYIAMEMTPSDPPEIPLLTAAEHKFRLWTNPSGTGLYVVTDNDLECDPGDEGGEYTEWSNRLNQSPRLIRCDIGNAASNVEVQMLRNGEHAFTTIASIGPIPHGWHREGGLTKYIKALATPEGVKPARLPANYHDSSVFSNSVDQARDAINGAVVGSALKEMFIASNAHVEIKPYWEGADKCTSGSLGCYTIGGAYPHLHNDKAIWILTPPSEPVDFFGVKVETQWTHTTSVYNLFLAEYTYYFLPNIMAHEMGHTLGLFHLPEGTEHIMTDGPSTTDWGGPALGSSERGPSGSDSAAFQRVTADHNE